MKAVQHSLTRDALDLSGIWRFRADQPGARVLPIAVPGSWNEQLAEAGYRDYTGPAWLERDVFIPAHAAGRAVALHFGSADYHAEVYWNGHPVGRSDALLLPFECDLTGLAVPGTTGRLAVRVTAELPHQGPMQRVDRADYQAQGRPKDAYRPAVRFDFFPFGGLNRQVHLLIRPIERILGWRIITACDGAVSISVCTTPGLSQLQLEGPADVAADVADGSATLAFKVPEPRLWSPDDPYLYPFRIVADGGKDVAEGRFGIRTVAVRGRELLLNGEPITLRGFGRHEDSPLHGRGLNLPQLAKDFRLLEWCGANSIRTGHYPHDEALLDLADECGLLVIGEVFSVNLDFRQVTAEGLDAHAKAVEAMIARDANHPCVIAWSLANEPGYLGEAVYRERSAPYWKSLFARARAADPSRPLTHANVQYAGLDDPAFDESDFLMLNRYYGWYSVPADLDAAEQMLRADFDWLADRHDKPLFLSEFGADALAGSHATEPQLFTEEYQADLIARYWKVIESHPAVIGGHVWNLADFRTAQHSRRVVMNLKGVFTRTREPKRAAFLLRQLWGGW